MKTKALAVVVLILAVLACGTPYWKSSATETPLETVEAPTALPANTVAAPVPTKSTVETLLAKMEYTVVGNANIRSCPSSDCAVVGYLFSGQRVNADCVGNWCKIETGWVYAPCLGFEGLCR